MTLQTLALSPAAACPPLDADRAAVFLDLDGTLAPIAPRPDDVRPDPELTGLLRRLGERLSGRLAVISGRTVADVDRILEGSVRSIAGVHGLERRTPNGAATTPPAPGLIDALRELRRFADSREGLLVEDKGLAVTIHYRQAPAEAEAVRDLALTLVAAHGLDSQFGDMVAELKTPGADKGASVRAFMAEPPFAGSIPVFVGDDLTDEDGFAAADALGGFGVLVAATRATAARHRLPDVAAVRSWLGAAL